MIFYKQADIKVLATFQPNTKEVVVTATRLNTSSSVSCILFLKRKESYKIRYENETCLELNRKAVIKARLFKTNDVVS